MYFPYLRGKQFELIALRDLCSIFSDDILKTITQMGDALESFNDGFNKLNDINFDIETIFQVTGEPVSIEYDEEMINANEKYDTQAEITQNNFKSIRTKYLDVRFDSDIDQVAKKRIEIYI